MTIQPDYTLFPNNIVKLVKDNAALIDTDVSVFMRPLRRSDPFQSIGITATLWSPQDYEIGTLAPEPNIQRYTCNLQAFILNPSEEDGAAEHTTLSHRLRFLVLRNASVRAGLSSMVATDTTTGTTVTESVSRWGVKNQRFLSNQINQDYLFLSTLEFWVDTQTY